MSYLPVFVVKFLRVVFLFMASLFALWLLTLRGSSAYIGQKIASLPRRQVHLQRHENANSWNIICLSFVFPEYWVMVYLKRPTAPCRVYIWSRRAMTDFMLGLCIESCSCVIKSTANKYIYIDYVNQLVPTYSSKWFTAKQHWMFYCYDWLSIRNKKTRRWHDAKDGCMGSDKQDKIGLCSGDRWLLFHPRISIILIH